MSPPVLLKACLNGARRRSDHRRCPVTPAELATAGEAAVAAGAAALHIHPRDEEGRETLTGSFVTPALDALRRRVTVPIGISTGAWIDPDPADRLRAIERWEVVPDFASVNVHEPGAEQIAVALLERGVGVEAGVWTGDAAHALVDSGLAPHCVRILFEPMENDLDSALATVRQIEDRLDGIAPSTPRLLHGVERTAWPLLDHAGSHGYDVRVGLEDTLMLPDGTVARDNAALVRAARRRLHGAPVE
jgi:uncharacterized protein (DUF849 family)